MPLYVYLNVSFNLMAVTQYIYNTNGRGQSLHINEGELCLEVLAYVNRTVC